MSLLRIGQRLAWTIGSTERVDTFPAIIADLADHGVADGSRGIPGPEGPIATLIVACRTLPAAGQTVGTPYLREVHTLQSGWSLGPRPKDLDPELVALIDGTGDTLTSVEDLVLAMFAGRAAMLRARYEAQRTPAPAATKPAARTTARRGAAAAPVAEPLPF